MKKALFLIAIVLLSGCERPKDYKLIDIEIHFKDGSSDTINVRDKFGINSNGSLFEYQNQVVSPQVIATDVKYIKRVNEKNK